MSSFVINIVETTWVGGREGLLLFLLCQALGMKIVY